MRVVGILLFLISIRLHIILYLSVLTLALFKFQTGAFVGLGISMLIITVSYFILKSNSKLKLSEEIGLTKDEEQIFKKYATYIIFPATKLFLLPLLQAVWASSCFFILICIFKMEWLFLPAFIFTTFISINFLLPRLCPEFLIKNAKAGIVQQQHELTVFNTMLSKYQSSLSKKISQGE